MAGSPNDERLKRMGATEHNVLVLLARGVSQRWIAERLGVSRRVITAEIESLSLKLDVAHATEIPYAYYKRTGRNPFDMETRG